MTSGGLEAFARRAWAGRTRRDRTLRAALVPASLAYGAAVTIRNRLYDAGWIAARRVPAHVVSVGNITVGGTGKTPAALWLAERLAARGQRVGIVTRGYGKRPRGVVVVGEAGRPLVGAEEGGDEAVMLARRFAGPVVAGEARAVAAAEACRRFALDTVVLDDGFQHRALVRDADLVLATDDVLGAWPLPAGPLREPPHGLARARAVLAVDGAPAAFETVPRFRGTLRPTALVHTDSSDEWQADPLDRLRGTPLVAVAGIARPERFVHTLHQTGFEIATQIPFPDHHRYTPTDATRIAIAAAGHPIITTEKDLVKLATFQNLEALFALRVTLEVEDSDSLVDLLLRTR